MKDIEIVDLNESDPYLAMATAIENMKSLVQQIAVAAERSAEVDSNVPVDTLSLLAQTPTAKMFNDYAEIVGSAMHRAAPEEVPRWDEMSRQQQTSIKNGVKGLIDAGFCIVEEEVVRFARHAHTRIAELEARLSEQA